MRFDNLGVREENASKQKSERVRLWARKYRGCTAAVEVSIAKKRSTGVELSNQRILRRSEYAQERFPLLPVELCFLDIVGSPTPGLRPRVRRYRSYSRVKP
jgi:hypothetical protein